MADIGVAIGPIKVPLGWALKIFVRWWQRPLQRRVYLRRIIASTESPNENPLHDIYRRFDLTRTYVEPTITLEDDPSSPPSARAYLLERCRSAGEFRLLIHQVFGMGKTALCLDLNYHLARAALKKWRAKCIPVYIPLRWCRCDSKEDLGNFFDQYLRQYKLTAFGSMRDLLKKPNVVLILDGFDQMATSGWSFEPVKLLGLIHDYLHGLPVKVILTIRSSHFMGMKDLSKAFDGHLPELEEQGRERRVPRFEPVFLERFNEQQLAAFLEKQGLSERLNLDKVRQCLRSNPHLRSFIVNPLLLKQILHSIDRIGADPASLDIGHVYKHYTDHWMAREECLAELSEDQKRQFVRDLATSLMRSADEAGVPLHQIMDIDKNNNWSFLQRDIRETTRHWDRRTRSFILVNRDRTLMFSHRSFMEYFCAVHLVDRLRGGGFVPDDLLEGRIYSNLVIWFARAEVSEIDFDLLWALLEDDHVSKRRIAHALIPRAATSDASRKKLLEKFEERFEREEDDEVKRHILFGIGWCGGNPCQRRFLEYAENRRLAWQRASLLYYHGEAQQREHCIARLESFRSGDREVFNSRGLYILDLELVGKPEDMELIEPYADADKEPDPEVCEIARRAVEMIRRRAGFW
jgi:hypothetical protein